MGPCNLLGISNRNQDPALYQLIGDQFIISQNLIAPNLTKSTAIGFDGDVLYLTTENGRSDIGDGLFAFVRIVEPKRSRLSQAIINKYCPNCKTCINC